MQLHYLEIVCTDVDAACSASAAFAQVLVMAAAFATDWGNPWGEPLEVVLVNGFFIALFCAAAWLFRRSANQVGRATA